MSFNVKLRNNQNALAATSIGVVTVGNVFGANTLLQEKVAPGSALIAKVTVIISTSSVTLAPIWQASLDGVTWITLSNMNNAAAVSLSASGTSYITLPTRVPYKYIRAAVLVGGATSAAPETLACSYNYIENDFQ